MSHARDITVVTGLGGAGRSTALHVLEDLGFYCIDNLPTPLLAQAVALCANLGPDARIAVGTDVRVRAFLENANDEIAALKARGESVTVVFLDADDAAIVRRYSETRRPHPLRAEMKDADVLTLINAERERLHDLRRRADRVIDTSLLTVHELRRTMMEMFGGAGKTRMVTRVMSFGFRYGIPLDADLVFDVRYLPNPHFVPELRPHTGRDADVARFVLERPETEQLLTSVSQLLLPLLPRYADEGKAVLTVAIGCTGGRHRSVAIAEVLSRRLVDGGAPGSVIASHRDMERGE